MLVRRRFCLRKNPTPSKEEFYAQLAPFANFISYSASPLTTTIVNPNNNDHNGRRHISPQMKREHILARRSVNFGKTPRDASCQPRTYDRRGFRCNSFLFARVSTARICFAAIFSLLCYLFLFQFAISARYTFNLLSGAQSPS
jgi:hypothetical protein